MISLVHFSESRYGWTKNDALDENYLVSRHTRYVIGFSMMQSPVVRMLTWKHRWTRIRVQLIHSTLLICVPSASTGTSISSTETDTTAKLLHISQVTIEVFDTTLYQPKTPSPHFRILYTGNRTYPSPDLDPMIRRSGSVAREFLIYAVVSNASYLRNVSLAPLSLRNPSMIVSDEAIRIRSRLLEASESVPATDYMRMSPFFRWLAPLFWYLWSLHVKLYVEDVSFTFC